MALHKQDFDYHLPSTLIAQKPISPRDHSRLLFFDKTQGRVINTDQHFYDLPQILHEKSQASGKEFVLVRNNSQVIPARIYGQKETGGQVEILLVKKINHLTSQSETWECLTKPGLKLNQKVHFPLPASLTTNSSINTLDAVCIQQADYTRQLEFHWPATFKNQKMTFADWLNIIGYTPLPPYIESSQPESELRKLYQTIYAQEAGSVAAPTAGLHFTPQIEKQLQNQGVEIIDVTLHVGLGTFLTVKTDDLSAHHMHDEQFSLDEQTAARLNQAKQQGKKIIALGTTTTRVLETCASPLLTPQTGSTDIFIYPPYQFKFVDHLITNFHLPESTLLMLISAFTSAPNTSHSFTDFLSSPVGQAYQTAIDEKFRFFSFGDAMLIW